MGDITGFIKYKRQDVIKEPVEMRKKHWREFTLLPGENVLRQQGARCMDCGVPFCHWGCPINNVIPDWNDLVYKGRWAEAYERLIATNNFPEFTGRLCPAPCETACVLGINEPAVTIRNIELAIIERAYEEGWVKPNPPKTRVSQNIAIVGSGPAGLACADQLNKFGFNVTVYEKNEDLGGILALGIPDFKLEKSIIRRRIDIMKQEGVEFKTGANIGIDISAKYLVKNYAAVVLTGGAERPRDLTVSGRELKGVYQAMEYLMQQNRINHGQRIKPLDRISAEGKKVVVVGGGDTGADCVGTANRQGAQSVTQLEILLRPPQERAQDNPWPQWATIYRKASSHEEGVKQDFAVLTKSLSGEKGQLKKLHAVRLEYGSKDHATGRSIAKEIPGSEFEIDCDMLILAMGFLGPNKTKLFEELNIELDQRGNVKTNENCMTSHEGVFAAGDMRRGQSLVVWAIQEGRRVAESIHQWLK